MNQRHLTVSCHYPERHASGSRHTPADPMPSLRLQGRWLDQAGFAIGANVRVAVTRGRLVLEVIESGSQHEQP